MSEVYRYEQILALPGECQRNQENFNYGLDVAYGGMQRLVEKGQLYGALFYGSAVFDGTNQTSDIDVFLAVHAFDAETTFNLKALVGRVNELTGVPLGLTGYTVEDLQNGRHWERAAKIDTLFQLAEERPDLVAGNNPLEVLRPLEQDLLADVDDYLTNRLREMTWSDLQGCVKNPEGVLEAVFNAPHRAGRKSLSALIHAGRLPEAVLPDMKKPTIARAVAETYGVADPAVTELNTDIQAEFDRYLILVDQVRAGHISADEYNQLIRASLSASLPLAIDYIRRLQIQYRRISGTG